MTSQISNAPVMTQSFLFRLMMAIGLCFYLAITALALPGDLDPSFGLRGVVTTPVTASIDEAQGVVLQPDGKIILAGFCYTGSDLDFCAVRYNANGTTDAFFGNNGRVTTPMSFNSDDRAFSVALQPDGKIVVAGSTGNTYAVVRYNQNGTLDTSFDGDGKVTTPVGDITGYASEVLIQPDGKILVAGGASQAPAGQSFAVVRYLTDGSLDMTFGIGGKSITPVGTNSATAYTIALQTDGKMIVAGSAFVVSNTNFALIRLNSDGTLDTSFDGDGKVLTSFSDWSSTAYALTVQTDGKIVAAGYALTPAFNFALARYNADGSLDTSFDTDGKVLTQVGLPGLGSLVASIKQQPDGKLVAGGYALNSSTYYDFAVVRYNLDGTLDTGFGTGGTTLTAITAKEDRLTDIALQPDGKIVVCGLSWNGQHNDFTVARYNSNGTPDAGFGVPGRVTTSIRNYADEARAVLVQPDGKIVAAGNSKDPSTARADFNLVRYHPNGMLDTTFHFDGIATTTLNFQQDDEAYAVALQPDGKILAAGYTGDFPNADMAVVRYNANGSLDTTFDGDGIFTLDIGVAAGSVQAVAVQPDGKIVLGGICVLQVDLLQKVHFAAVRLNANGSLDTTFETDGVATTLVGTRAAYANALALQTDGKIVLAGWTDSGSFSDFAVVRFNTDGSLDSSFGTGGRVMTPVGNGNDSAQAIALQPDGKIVVAGFSDSSTFQDFALVRYNPNGTLDIAFDGDGKVLTTVNSTSTDSAYAVMLQTGGKLVVAGVSVNVNTSNFSIALARYNSNGSLDTTFGGDGIVTTDWGAEGETAYAAALQPDSKIVVAGGSNKGPHREFTVLRYLASQSPVFDFDGDGKTDVSVFRPSTGYWYLSQSTAGFRAAQFGQGGDMIAPADYDGDGKTDTAVFRPADGHWYFLDSSTGVFRFTQFGQGGDIPATGDYDGDGKADICVFRPSAGTFYLLHSSNNSFNYQQWGTNGDVPVMGDYDGDGKTDFAIFRPSDSIFYVLRSSNDSVIGQQWGASGDKPIAADFDGDGKTDIAVYRPSAGAWYYLQSSDNGFKGIAWGASGDVPAAGDYDGDGKSDIAIFRPSTGVFYILQSTNNSLRAEQFGTNGDLPVPAAFVP